MCGEKNRGVSVCLLANPLVCSSFSVADFYTLRAEVRGMSRVSEVFSLADLFQGVFDAETLFGQAMIEQRVREVFDAKLLVVVGGLGTTSLLSRIKTRAEASRPTLVLDWKNPVSEPPLGTDWCRHMVYTGLNEIPGLIADEIERLFDGQGFLFDPLALDHQKRSCCGRCGNRCTTGNNGGGPHQVRVPITENVA